MSISDIRYQISDISESKETTAITQKHIFMIENN